jgi:rubrerythrin
MFARLGRFRPGDRLCYKTFAKEQALELLGPMTNGTVYAAGWMLDDIHWSEFDSAKVEPGLLAAVKAAALVEYNAPDYVSYLHRVFAGSPQQTLDDLARWGTEESQHGRALARWAEMADPGWSFDNAFARFQAGYNPPHFRSDTKESIRGSRRGEMIARCVVESGTSSYYSAIRDAADEPVLKEIAGHIAADEFRHYRLFFDTLQAQDEPELPFWRKLLVALGRVNESDDDELAFAYYCANVSAEEEAARPYDRAGFAKASYGRTVQIYRRHHVRKLVQMVAKAIGADPQSRLTEIAARLMWRMLRIRGGLSASALRESSAAV